MQGTPEHPQHGTENGYCYYRCRCEACREAHRVQNYDRQKQATARPVPNHVHGTETGYVYYRCPCTECLENMRLIWRHRNEQRKSA